MAGDERVRRVFAGVTDAVGWKTRRLATCSGTTVPLITGLLGLHIVVQDVRCQISFGKSPDPPLRGKQMIFIFICTLFDTIITHVCLHLERQGEKAVRRQGR